LLSSFKGGGAQKRAFTYIDDAVEALLTILENKDECASRRIFNSRYSYISGKSSRGYFLSRR